MCAPVMAALSIASTVAGLYGQQQAADAQKDYNKQMYKNAVTANNQRNAQISQRQIQERDAATNKIMQNNIEAAKAKSTARVAASNAGVSGVSVDSLLADLSGAQGRYNSSVTENLRASNAGSDWDRVNAYNDMASTINGLKAPTMPNYLGAALQIGTAVDTYNTKSGGKLY
jgi:hypothetical protein